MVPNLTLRRKLQKKKKRKPYGKCPLCGNRVTKYVYELYNDKPRLWGACINRKQCEYRKEYFWSGGGTVDT